MHHFVNGGGGAYLSIGTALAKAYSMPTEDYAYYPSKDPLISKINKNTSWYKYPAWWYTKKFDGWPFSAEWLSAAFDYNVAPFFQSFMEVRVEPSKKECDTFFIHNMVLCNGKTLLLHLVQDQTA